MPWMKMGVPVLNKQDMYDRIITGEFGNTLPRWFDWEQWRFAPGGYASKPLWGIQSTTKAGDPRARLNYPRDQVFDYLVQSGLLRDGYCISPMVTQYGKTRWEGDVYDSDDEGLVCCGNVSPEPGTWRKHMQQPKMWKRSAALVLLRTVLTEYSFADLMSLRDRFPGHVYEFTALDCDYGTLPGRNAVIWEVRNY